MPFSARRPLVDIESDLRALTKREFPVQKRDIDKEVGITQRLTHRWSCKNLCSKNPKGLILFYSKKFLSFSISFTK